MSEIVERVAQALCEASAVRSIGAAEPVARRALIKFARVAIAAMREPTPAMEAAGAAAEGGCEPSCEHQTILRPGLIWQAMIEAALKASDS